jgi:tetratricopeptide (TPR) repeat protein
MTKPNEIAELVERLLQASDQQAYKDMAILSTLLADAASALEQAQARIAELERELACWKFNTRDDRRLAEDWERHVARIAELEEKIENLEMAIAAYKIAAPTPQGEIVEEKCPCGSHPFAFNFEPGDGEITCAWCGRNMN